MTQTDEIHSGGSYISQNDLRVHFGLNTATKIDSVEIRWPSGAIDQLKDLAVDKFYAVLEGKGVVPPEQIRPSPPPAKRTPVATNKSQAQPQRYDTGVSTTSEHSAAPPAIPASVP